MLRISEIKLSLDSEFSDIEIAVAKTLKINKNRILKTEIFKRSIDSRKDSVHFVYTADVTVDGDEDKILASINNSKVIKCEKYSYKIPQSNRKSTLSPVIAGFGPAGMFAGLILARSGHKPIIIERGRDVDSRTNDVNNFWTNRILDEKSNIQYGEGGAGTFSDGKLTTGIKDSRCRFVFEEFVSHGAPEDILVNAKPHIGTDKLKTTVKAIREEIISLGGQVLFETQLTNIIVANNFIHGVTVTDKNGKETDIETDALILSIGHSARDTIEMLYYKGITMMQKPFSIGARIEHPQEFINSAQFGEYKDHPRLPAADYKLACHPPHGRGAYTFCMCPGGTVVCASSQKGGVVTNGMSEYARDKENANSAILVGVNPEDFPSEHVLAGFTLQREIEEKAFNMGGGDYTAPATLVGDFLKGQKSTKLGAVKPSFPTGVTMSDIGTLLPQKVVDNMRHALTEWDKKLKGFAMDEAVLTAPETRSSSPVRIIRDEFYQTNVRGLYPCGEGAGYAGGIVSAAVDGVKCAEMVLSDET